MAKLQIQVGSTSKTVKVFAQNNSVTTGAGLTGLVYNTSGLTAYYLREGASASVAISLATATLGTWTSGGFIVGDGTNMGGVYELGIPNLALASGAKSVLIYIQGAANLAPVPIEIELTATNNQDGIAGGMSALPQTACTTNASLLTSGTGTDQLSVSSGNAAADAKKINGVSTSSVAAVGAYIGNATAAIGVSAGGKITEVVTVDTSTNLTNAPTNGDLTAAMKASVTAAVPSAATIQSGLATTTQLNTKIPTALTYDGGGLPLVDATKFAGNDPVQTGGKLWVLDADGNATPTDTSIQADAAAAIAAAGLATLANQTWPQFIVMSNSSFIGDSVGVLCGWFNGYPVYFFPGSVFIFFSTSGSNPNTFCQGTAPFADSTAYHSATLVGTYTGDGSVASEYYSQPFIAATDIQNLPPLADYSGKAALASYAPATLANQTSQGTGALATNVQATTIIANQAGTTPLASGTVSASPAPTTTTFVPGGGYSGIIPASGYLTLAGVQYAYTWDGTKFTGAFGTAPSGGASWCISGVATQAAGMSILASFAALPLAVFNVALSALTIPGSIGVWLKNLIMQVSVVVPTSNAPAGTVSTGALQCYIGRNSVAFSFTGSWTFQGTPELQVWLPGATPANDQLMIGPLTGTGTGTTTATFAPIAASNFTQVVTGWKYTLDDVVAGVRTEVETGTFSVDDGGPVS